jgi:hypothetical protein
MLMIFLKVNLVKSMESWILISKINHHLDMIDLKKVYYLDFMQEIQDNY